MDGAIQTGLDTFCETNQTLWCHAQSDPAQSATGVILIDLWHSNVQYLLRSLVIAKFIQSVQPARLIGLMGQPGVVAQSCGVCDFDFIERLARSFGITELLRVPTPSFSDHQQADLLLDRLEPAADLDRLTAAELRRRLADLMLEDGFPIGRFVYDTTLRSDLRPTIDRIDGRLRQWAADCLGLHRWISEVCRTVIEPIAFVTGHLDYNPWGLTGEVVRRGGGEVFWFRLDSNVAIYRIGPLHAGTLNAAYHQIEADWFNEVIWPRQQALAAGADAFAVRLASGVLQQRWTAVRTAALPAMTAQAAAAALRVAYGFGDGVVVGVFAHAMSDQPLADAQVFADRYQWLAQTLAFAARHPKRFWVVKLHPRDAAYDATRSTHELIQRFGRLAHIRFIVGQVSAGVMEALCDVAVTIFGAPGLEMAAAGRPVIVAGRGPYAGCGFVHWPANSEQYEALLLAEPVSLGLTPEQVMRAKLYAYAVRVVGAPSSSLLAQPMTPASDAYWRFAEAGLREHTLPGDDLYEAVRRMIADGQHRTTNPAIDRFCLHGCITGLEHPTPKPQPQALPLLGADPLTFEHGSPGVRGLIKGFHLPEPSGVWMQEEVATLGFHIELAEPCPVTVMLRYMSLGSSPGWPAQAISVFCETTCLVERKTLDQTGEIEIVVPAEAVLGSGDIVLAIAVDRLSSPVAMGINQDTRLLGVLLLEIIRLTL